ncbi:MAG: ribose-phosphate pyrophosphokinase, partial [Candidatus Dormibacteria bacterium]
GALRKIDEADVDEVVVTDSIPLSPEGLRNPKVSQVSVAPLIAEAIVRIHEGRSVSALFR